MLQFIAQQSDKYSLAEQMQMAIEGGCAWIQLHAPELSDEEIRELAKEFIPLCKETSTILMLEDRTELAKELGLHGVHLTDPDVNARKIREDYGPEAIIGVEVRSPQGVFALKGMDIDYVTVTPKMSLDEAAELIRTARDAGSTMPIVVSGDFDASNVESAIATGASGVATGRRLTEAADPVTATEEIMAILRKE